MQTYKDIPVANDPICKEWTANLLLFLKEPKSWKDIRAWSRLNDIKKPVIVNMLAWLSINDLIDFSDDKWGQIKKPVDLTFNNFLRNIPTA